MNLFGKKYSAKSCMFKYNIELLKVKKIIIWLYTNICMDTYKLDLIKIYLKYNWKFNYYKIQWFNIYYWTKIIFD